MSALTTTGVRSRTVSDETPRVCGSFALASWVQARREEDAIPQ
jgi:hypothetical protein